MLHPNNTLLAVFEFSVNGSTLKHGLPSESAGGTDKHWRILEFFPGSDYCRITVWLNPPIPNSGWVNPLVLTKYFLRRAFSPLAKSDHTPPELTNLWLMLCCLCFNRCAQVIVSFLRTPYSPWLFELLAKVFQAILSRVYFTYGSNYSLYVCRRAEEEITSLV